ncbi:MAG: D-cysteine desulfhydrase family protein, partial [Anaerolineae bacterium]
MKLATLPRLRLATLPTPLQRARRLSAALGGPDIWFKRDDLTGFALGGNKVRKLEFLAAEAVAQGADIIVTGAGAQSNHVRTTVAVARHLGLDCRVVLYGSRPAQAQGNLLLDELLGAEIVFTNDPDRSRLDRRIAEEGERLRAEGRQPYVIGRGGASPLGGAGYVACALELAAQLVDSGLQPDHLVCPVGSCGTLAGLIAGSGWLRAGYRLHGVTVSRARAEVLERLQALASETAALLDLGLDPVLDPARLVVYEDYIGPGYGVPTPEGIEAIRLVAQTEGVFLDPVYSGKAMAGLIDLIRRGQFGPGETVVFLHSGGWPALFAHALELGD